MCVCARMRVRGLTTGQRVLCNNTQQEKEVCLCSRSAEADISQANQPRTPSPHPPAPRQVLRLGDNPGEQCFSKVILWPVIGVWRVYMTKAFLCRSAEGGGQKRVIFCRRRNEPLARGGLASKQQPGRGARSSGSFHRARPGEEWLPRESLPLQTGPVTVGPP